MIKGSINLKEFADRIYDSIEYLKDDRQARCELIKKYSLDNINIQEFNNYFDKIFFHNFIDKNNYSYSDIELQRLINLLDKDELNDYFIYANKYLKFDIHEEEDLLIIADKVLYFKSSKYFNIISKIIDKEKEISNFFKYYDYYSLDLDTLISFINKFNNNYNVNKHIINSYLNKIKYERNRVSNIEEIRYDYFNKLFNESDKYILITNYLYNVLFSNLNYDISDYINYNNEFVNFLIKTIYDNRKSIIKPKKMYMLFLKYKDYFIFNSENNISGLIILFDYMKKYDKDNFINILKSFVDDSPKVLCSLIGNYQYYYNEIFNDKYLLEHVFIKIINSDVEDDTFNFMCRICIYGNNFTNEKIIIESLKRYDRFIIIMDNMNDELKYHQNGYFEMLNLFKKYINNIKDNEFKQECYNTIKLYEGVNYE